MLKKSRVALCRLLEVALILAVLVLVLDVLWGVLTRWSGSFVVWLSEEKGVEAWAFLPRGQNQLTEEIARFLLIWISLDLDIAFRRGGGVWRKGSFGS